MLPRHPLRAAGQMVVLVAVLYAVEFADLMTPADLETNGIVPHEVGGLDGILWAPLLHGTWDHLFANTVPLLVLG